MRLSVFHLYLTYFVGVEYAGVPQAFFSTLLTTDNFIPLKHPNKHQ